MTTLKQRHTGVNGLEQLDSPAQYHNGPKPLTLSWREIPAWMRDNEYILSGYRRLVVTVIWADGGMLTLDVLESRIPSLGVSSRYLDVSVTVQ
jgi:hypothetical protein